VWTRRAAGIAGTLLGRAARAVALAVAAGAVAIALAVRQAASGVGRGGRGVLRLGGRTARRVAGVASTDARAVAGSATAAGRRLRPEPQVLAPDEAPLSMSADLASATTTRLPAPTDTTVEMPPVDAAVPVGVRTVGSRTEPARRHITRPGRGPGSAGPRRGRTAPPRGLASLDSEVAAPVVAGNGNGDRASSGNGTDTATVGTATHGTGTSGTATQGNGAHGDAGPAVTAAPPPARHPRRRDGVVVPLRVPFTHRLRAGVGLCALVLMLGTATAVVVAAVAVAAAQALGQI